MRLLDINEPIQFIRRWKSTNSRPYSISSSLRYFSFANEPRKKASDSQLSSNWEPQRAELFKALDLNSFNHEEISRAYKTVYEQPNGDGNHSSAVNTERLHHLIKSTQMYSKEFNSDVHNPKLEDFRESIIKLGQKLDPRVWPLGLSFLGTGLSIGIITPILPLLVKEIALPPSQFGLIVSAFGLAKLIGNIPTAQWADTYGRKKVMVSGMLLCSIGIGSIGLCVLPGFGAPSLIASRMVTGLGVAAFSSAAVMMLADISTSLNRTRTMSPVNASFQAGTALGPALGGFAVQYLSLSSSYFAVGGMIATLATLNHFYLSESRPGVYSPPMTPSHTNCDNSGAAAAAESTAPQATMASSSERLPQSHSAAASSVSSSAGPPASAFASAFTNARQSWGILLKRDDIRSLVAINVAYWVAFSGTNLTLLPLFLVGPTLELPPAQIGMVFAGMSIVSVAASQPIAWVADKYSKSGCVTAGMCMFGASMVALSQVSGHPEWLPAVLVPLSIGSTILSTVPTSSIADMVSEKERGQATSLLRTAGDVGLLFGATLSGFLSGAIGIPGTMQINGAILGSCATLWALRRRLFYAKP